MKRTAVWTITGVVCESRRLLSHFRVFDNVKSCKKLMSWLWDETVLYQLIDEVHSLSMMLPQCYTRNVALQLLRSKPRKSLLELD